MEFLANRSVSVSVTCIHSLFDGDQSFDFFALCLAYFRSGMSEWQDERPPAPSYIRVLYLGRMLQDDETLAGECLSNFPSVSFLFYFLHIFFSYPMTRYSNVFYFIVTVAYNSTSIYLSLLWPCPVIA